MTGPAIELFPGAEQSAFAAMMSELIRSNLEDRPEKMRDFCAMRGRVALVAEDAEATITLHFQAGKLSVHPGLHGVPDLLVRGSSEALIDLSRVPHHPRLSFLPDLRSAVAKSLGRALFERKLRIGGLASSASLALKLARVLSIY
jgi:hypothetical protein